VIAVGAQALTFTTKREGHRSGTAIAVHLAATTRDHHMSDKVPSAADHEWREIFIHIYPNGEGAHFIVRLRRFKGSTIIWDRRLGSFDVVPADGDTVQTLAGILTLVGMVATEAGNRARH
jgi:hypothetical protein